MKSPAYTKTLVKSETAICLTQAILSPMKEWIDDEQNNSNRRVQIKTTGLQAMTGIIVLKGAGAVFFGLCAYFTLVWGGQGDGYHYNPRDAAETGNVIALFFAVLSLTLIVNIGIGIWGG